ncbi:hypothetical protein GCM10022226_62420 [Sphaerisporangium flaviroseum]|uniref:Uncharacterized protein n=1 Tax=Sphaerisporangium flaviroseum TaxID=509199 RepID=A0ABP7J301_9ACTN
MPRLADLGGLDLLAEHASELLTRQELPELIQLILNDDQASGSAAGRNFLLAAAVAPRNGSLTEGEQLRLKIVTTIALLRHGFRSGVGRHPGLLLVDSPGAEEVDSGDLRHMLEDLVVLFLTAALPHR